MCQCYGCDKGLDKFVTSNKLCSANATAARVGKRRNLSQELF